MTISVVIPVKNEAIKVRECIEGLLQQTIKVKEIIVIDSGSTDGTQDIVRGYKEVLLVEIPSSEFNHGTTRNLGVSKATGDYILFTVGDAKPTNNQLIEYLLHGFDDEMTDVVCGQQIVPHDKDKNPLQWFRPLSEPVMQRYQFKSNEEFQRLSPAEKKRVCGLDNVVALYRKQALVDIPFENITYCEDAVWAKRTIEKGRAIVYNPAGKVYHYHNENPAFVYKFSFATMFFRYKQFGYIIPKPSFSLQSRLRMVSVIFKGVGFDVKAFLKWYAYNIDNYKSFVLSYDAFIEALKAGEEELERQHSKICSYAPIPIK